MMRPGTKAARSRSRTVYVAEPSQSGRSIPREVSARRLLSMTSASAARSERDCMLNISCVLRAVVSWSIALDRPGHSLADLVRLVAQHSGVADVTLTTTEALLALLAPTVVQA